MTDYFARGIMSVSHGASWHGKETLVSLPDTATMLREGRAIGALPIGLRFSALNAGPLGVDSHRAVCADYQAHPSQVVGVVGGTYRYTELSELAALCDAAEKAGATPTGLFSLHNGSVVCATYQVSGEAHGMRTHLLILDSYDGSTPLMAGMSVIRAVCQNTVSAALSRDGGGFGRIKHTASAEEKINVMVDAVGCTVRSGAKVTDSMARAEMMRLDAASAKVAFDRLFPPAPEGAKPSAVTRAENIRDEARRAARLPVNVAGPPGTLANLWNAATFLVDREVDGSLRPCRGDAMASMLLGTRAERIAEVQAVIETVMRDGTIQRLSVADARSHGIDDRQIGRAILADMMGE